MDSSHYFIDAKQVSLQEILAAKEQRAVVQRALILKYRLPLVSFTMNIPGEYKQYPLAERAFEEGLWQIGHVLENAGIRVVFQEKKLLHTGCEGYFLAEQSPPRLKQLMMGIEDTHPLGGFFNIDVLSVSGAKVQGSKLDRKEKVCPVCRKPVAECVCGKRRSAEELAVFTAQQFAAFFEKEML